MHEPISSAASAVNAMCLQEMEWLLDGYILFASLRHWSVQVTLWLSTRVSSSEGNRRRTCMLCLLATREAEMMGLFARYVVSGQALDWAPDEAPPYGASKRYIEGILFFFFCRKFPFPHTQPLYPPLKDFPLFRAYHIIAKTKTEHHATTSRSTNDR